MKNVIKLLSIMLIAGTVMVSCTEKPNEGNTPDTPVTYTVQVNSNNAILGTATISPLKSTYNSGDTVILTATPANGAKFLNWNGSITDNPYTYVVKENAVFTANFEALPQSLRKHITIQASRPPKELKAKMSISLTSLCGW